MYGSGVLIGMEITQVLHRQIRKDLLLAPTAPTVSFVVALGATSRGTAVSPIAPSKIRPVGTVISASASPSPVSLTC